MSEKSLSGRPDVLHLPANSRLLQRLALIGSFWFSTIFVYVQVEQWHDPLSSTVSSFFNGPYGGWYHFAFYIFALSIALFAFSVRPLMRSRWNDLGVFFLLICALFVAATAGTDGSLPFPGKLGHSVHARIHFWCAITAFVSALSAMSIFTGLVWRRPIFRVTRYIMVFLDVGILVALASDPVFQPIHGGLEKLVIVGMVVWQVVATQRFMTLPAPVAESEFDPSARDT